jgi:integrase
LPSYPLLSEATTFVQAARHFFVCAAAGKAMSTRNRPFAPSSLQVMDSAVRRCLIPSIGDLPLDSITRLDLQYLFAQAAPFVSPHTLVAAKAALDGIFCVAERDGLFDGSSPAEGLKVGRPSARRVGQVLTRPEQRWFGEVARAEDDARRRSLMYPLVELLLGTGLRIGEACALIYDPVSGLNLDGRQVHVTRTVSVTWTEEKPVRLELAVCDRTKTPCSRASVPLGRRALAALIEHRRATGGEDGGLVFFGPGGQLTYSSRPPLQSAWTDLKQRAGFPGLRFHDLRHTFGSTLIHMGVSLPTVARLMRHKSPAVTLATYAHELGDQFKIDQYDDWLEDDGEDQDGTE